MDWTTGVTECCRACDYTGIGDEPALNWVIVGGESGDEARPMNPEWVRQIKDICGEAKVAFHFKQWGEWAPARGTEEGDVIFHRPDPGRPDPPGFFRIAETMRRVGKHKAGRSIRGREYQEFPDAA